MATLVELERSSLPLAVMCHKPGVFMFNVYENGSYFNWFEPSTMTKNVVNVGSMIINHESYTKVTSVDDLYEKTFCQIGNTVYCTPDDYNPLWIYYMPKYGMIIGVTDGQPGVYDGKHYKAGLDYTPDLSDKADNLEYGSMTFKNDNIEIINITGEYDNTIDFFGNNCRVKMAVMENGVLQIKNLYEYYVKNIKIKADKTTFICGDRREKLSQKVPNKRFTREEFPYIADEHIDEIMQDVYGLCSWVKCVCVDELDILIDPEGEDIEANKKQYRTFYVSRKITELYFFNEDGNVLYDHHVWIKQTQINTGVEEEVEKFSEQERWTIRPIDLEHSDFAKGLIAIDIKYCMPALWKKDEIPELFEVRAIGLFWTPSVADVEINRPSDLDTTQSLDIIVELLYHYCGIPYNDYNYNITDLLSEIGNTGDIGIVFDEEISIFEAIEKLQDAGYIGFRFVTEYNRFTAKANLNNKPVKENIKITDIVDIGKAEIDMNSENYATVIDVPYSKDWSKDEEKAYKHCINKNNQESMKVLYGVDKTYKANSYLYDDYDAQYKADNLELFFKKTHPMINNLTIINHPDLRVYDIVTVDLRIPIERKKELRQFSSLFSDHPAENVVFGDWPSDRITVDFDGIEDNQEYRMFGGVLKCKVMSFKLDLQTGENTVSLLEIGE